MHNNIIFNNTLYFFKESYMIINACLKESSLSLVLSKNDQSDL